MKTWSQLPSELVVKIAENIILYPDYVRFRAVSPGWRSCLPEKPKNLPHQLPSLMLPPQTGPESDSEPDCESDSKDEEQKNHGFGFFSVFLGETYGFELPEEAGKGEKMYRGSSHGWIVTVEKGPSIYLINPLTGAQSELPPITGFHNVVEYDPNNVGQEYVILSRAEMDTYYEESYSSKEVRDRFIEKIVLSSSPSNNYIAMAIYGEMIDESYLAICKPGHKKWTRVTGKNDFRDVVIYNDKYYAVECDGNVFMIVDLDSDHPKAVKVARRPKGLKYTIKLYLVESSGDLLMVSRYFSSIQDPTTNFKVYKLNLDSGKCSLLKTLGDRVLFLGFNYSLSLFSRNLPGCNKDCIYFTDDRQEEETLGTDIGFFDYKSKTVKPLPGYIDKSRRLKPAPIWVIPNP